MKNLDDGPDGLNDEAFDRMLSKPAKAKKSSRPKRPAFHVGDKVTLSFEVSTIPAYGGKPAVLHDTVLRVHAFVGTGNKRNPYGVTTTDGMHFWGHAPGDLIKVERCAQEARRSIR